MFSKREEFIAYSVARYVTHLGNASPTDYNTALTIAMTLANKLEMAGVAPWPISTWQVQPPAPQLPLAQPPHVQGQSSAAEENTRRLLANIGQPPPAQGAPTGTIVGDTGAPKVGTAQNPVQAGAVIAAHGEVQGHREQVIGPTIGTPGIVSDVQAVRQPGVVPGTPNGQ